jgi:predicted nucleic acid-binding protein
MAIGLLDTTVVVDLLRNYPPASVWLNAQTRLGITPIVWMETLDGALNKAAQRRAVALLTQFDIVYLTQADMDRAMRQLAAYKLSHNSGMMDCLIASVSHRLQVPLFTRNIRHFTPLLGPLAQSPY